MPTVLEPETLLDNLDAEVECEVHIVANGRVIYPRAIICADDPLTIRLTDQLGGKIPWATVENSGWRIRAGYATATQIAAGMTDARQPVSITDDTAGRRAVVPSSPRNTPNNNDGNTALENAVADTRRPPPSNTTPSERLVPFNLRIPGSLKAAVEAQARRLNLSASAVVRNALSQHLVATAGEPSQSTTSDVMPVAPLRGDPLIVSALSAFRDATAQTSILLNDYPTATGIAHAVLKFRRASNLLDTLADDDRPPQAILNILRDVRDTVVPTLPALRQMRADIEGARPKVATFAGHLHAARDQLQDLIWSCERFC